MASRILLNSRLLLAVLLVVIKHNNTLNQRQFVELLIVLLMDRISAPILVLPLLLLQTQLPALALNRLHNLHQVPLLALALVHHLHCPEQSTVCLNNRYRSKDSPSKMKTRLLTDSKYLNTVAPSLLHYKIKVTILAWLKAQAYHQQRLVLPQIPLNHNLIWQVYQNMD